MNDHGYPDLAFPAYFEMETLRACNARCPFCPFGAGQIRNSGPMAEALYAKIRDELIERRDEVARVTLAVYCEPLLDADLEAKVAGLKRGGIGEVAVTSNASLLDERRAVGLLEAGIDILRMSISTINPEKYRKLRVGLDLGTVMANAERYFRLRDRINPASRIYISMEKHDVLDKEDGAAWKRHWGGLIGPNDVLKTAICFDRIVEDRRALGDERHRGPCHAIFQTLDIAYSGHALFCSADFKAGASPYVLGDLNRQSIAEIWNGETARRYREMHRASRRNEIEICRGCDLWSDELKENFVRGA